MAKEKAERKRKKRRKKHYFLRLIVFILLCVGMYFLLKSSFFDVQKIHVENNNYYTAEQIIDKAGAKTGQNLFFDTKSDSLKNKLLKDPYVKSVKVSKIPPGTIKIQVEERIEAAAVPYANTFVFIDKDGMVLKKTDTEPKLPLLLGLTVKKMEPGKPLEVEENSVLTDTLYMLDTMEDSDIYFKKIDISNVIIKAYIYDQLICQGTPDDILENMDNGNLETVLYDLYTNGIERGIINIGSDNYCSFNPMVE